MRLARRKLGKNNTPQPWWPPSPYDLHGAPPRHRRIRQSANMLCDKSISLKLENKIVFTIYLLFKGMAHRVDAPCLCFPDAIRWHADSSRT
jgi:hypothetical protein